MNSLNSSSAERDPVAVAIENCLHHAAPGSGGLRIVKKPNGFQVSFQHLSVHAPQRDIALIRLAALLLGEGEWRVPLVKALRGPYALHDRDELVARRHLRCE